MIAMDRNVNQMRVNCNQINNNLQQNNSTFNAMKYNFNNNNKNNGFKDKSEANVKHNKPLVISQSSHKSNKICDQMSSTTANARPHTVSSSATSTQPSSQLMSATTTTRANNMNNNPSLEPLMDRTPCGSAQTSPHFDESYETPPHSRWQQDFEYLICDADGARLFRSYLSREGLEPLLDFWYAVRGLKDQDSKDLHKFIKVIYKTFVRKNAINVSNDVFHSLKHEFSAKVTDEIKHSEHVFDAAHQEVEEQLKGSIYDNFFSSDDYFNYLQPSATNGEGLGATGGYDYPPALTNDRSIIINTFESSLDDYNQFVDVLPTVDEDCELKTIDRKANSNPNSRSQSTQRMPSYPGLEYQNLISSKNTLIQASETLKQIQYKRAVHQRIANRGAKIEMHPMAAHNPRNTYMLSKANPYHPPHPYHVQYSTVIPTSAQDSEAQSISSQSTNDSKTRAHSGCERTMRSSKQYQLYLKANAEMNPNGIDPNVPNPKPRTMTGRCVAKGTPLTPMDFMNKLVPKLEKLRNDIEIEEQNDRKIKEVFFMAYADASAANKPNPPHNSHHLVSNSANNSSGRPNMPLKDVFRQVKDLTFRSPPEDSDNILDDHISKVFVDTPNETPTDPSVRSPKNSYTSNQYSTQGFEQHRSGTSSVGSAAIDSTTQVIVTIKYSTESLPYRLVMAGPNVTLRQFKQKALSGQKKSQCWQYFFKRKFTDQERDDYGRQDAEYFLEMITDDQSVLPQIEGRIYAELHEIV